MQLLIVYSVNVSFLVSAFSLLAQFFQYFIKMIAESSISRNIRKYKEFFRVGFLGKNIGNFLQRKILRLGQERAPGSHLFGVSGVAYFIWGWGVGGG